MPRNTSSESLDAYQIGRRQQAQAPLNARLDTESILAAPSDAFTLLSDGDDEAYGEAGDARNEELCPRQPLPREWAGRFGEPGDRALIPVRLPRPAALFPIP
jgi:hypothetical protein